MEINGKPTKDSIILLGFALAIAVLSLVELLLLHNARQEREATMWASRTHDDGPLLVAEGEVPLPVDQVLNKPPKLQHLRPALAACWQTRPTHRP